MTIDNKFATNLESNLEILADSLDLTNKEIEEIRDSSSSSGRRFIRVLFETYGDEKIQTALVAIRKSYHPLELDDISAIDEDVPLPVFELPTDISNEFLIKTPELEKYDPDIILLAVEHGSKLASNLLDSGNAVEVGYDSEDALVIAISDESDFILQQKIRRFIAPDKIRFVLATKEEIALLSPEKEEQNQDEVDPLAAYDDFQRMIDRDITPLTQQVIEISGDQGEIVASRLVGETLVAKIFESALAARATDIHVDPYGPSQKEPEGGFNIRFRIDKVLRLQQQLSRSGAEGLRTADVIARTMKMASGVDISDRLPSDFRVARNIGNRTVYARVHTHPAHVGTGGTATKSTIRILEGRRRSLDGFGFSPELLASWRDSLDEGWGLSLVSGPMGSGKSSAVFASLPEIVNSSLAAYSVEDPVEFDIPGITQYEINARNLAERADLMTRTLHDLRRQDANFVLIGEIRDKQSMELAFDLATSGVRVLATIHAASAVHTVQRLLEWELDPFIVATTLRTVLNMRLLQRLCSDCKLTVGHDDTRRWPDEIFGMKLPETGFIPNPSGCIKCDFTGTVGQFPIGELLHMSKVTPNQLRTSEGLTGLSREIVSLESQAFDALSEGKTHILAVRNSQIGTTSEMLLAEEIEAEIGISEIEES